MGKIEMLEPDVSDAIELEPREPSLPATQQQTPSPAGRQLSVVEYAMQHGATAAEVRALVELQIQMDNHKLAMLKQQDEREREERDRQAVLAFRRDFAAFRGENIIIPKTKEVDRGRGGSFYQAEFHVACQMLSPALSRHGFSFRHDQKYGSKAWTTDDKVSDVPWVYVTCYLEHSSGYTERLDLEGPPGELAVNTPVQNMQVTGSFLKRQSLLAITGTATGGEDDEARMRKAGVSGGDASPDMTEALVQAGRDASINGTAALNKWWGSLTARERADLTNDFGSLRKAAAAADKQSRGAE